MFDSRAALLTVAILAPITGSAAAIRKPLGRRAAIAATAVSFMALVASLLVPPAAAGPLVLDRVVTAPALAFAAIMLLVFAAASKSDTSGRQCAGTLISFAGTLTVYCAADPLLLFAGFALGALPFLFQAEAPSRRAYTQPSVVLGISIFMMGIGVMLMRIGGRDTGIGTIAFVLIVTAALMRNGVFPFHSWLISAYDIPSSLPLRAILSGHVGVVVIVRLGVSAFPEAAALALPVLSNLALVGTLFTAFVALGERAPRRIIALLAASQSGFIISGIESRNVEGITGALVHWLVVAVSTAGLITILRCLEARCGDLLAHQFAGIGARTPRLAVLFLIFGLALVGLPGTLGFCAEDLLFHGALETHPYLGVALPIATAISAINILRLFSWVFLGRGLAEVPPISDALPRERWAMTAMALFLILFGIAPRALIASRALAAQNLLSVFSGDKGSAKESLTATAGRP